MKHLFDHYSYVPEGFWRWPSFSPEEMACRGTGQLMVDVDAMDKLQKLRDALGKPIIIRSAYRSPEHNRRVKGAPKSKHMEGIAFDCAMTNHDPATFEAMARFVGFTSFGYYPDRSFMHIDTRPEPATWGKPFPARLTFEPERPAPRQDLAQSRTLAGSGVAAGGIGGATALDAANEALAGAQGQLVALVPYLDTARWLLVAVALAGVALTVYARIDDWKSGRR